MTKKSNNRKLPVAQRQPPQRYREVILDIPVEMYSRILKAQEKAIEQKLLDPKLSPREFILLVLANGVGMVEADQHARERQSSLVVTPQEAAEMAARMPKRG